MNERVFLLRALALAEQRRGFCAPNPSVGALIVKEGRVIAEAYHEACGLPHAEKAALSYMPEGAARGAQVYVTLEPCCHHGRTPPCTDALMAAGVAEVIYAYPDPNPLVQGRGKATLEKAGILCREYRLAETDVFYRSYQHWTETKRPWVTAKLALSLDGKIAGPGGQTAIITGPSLAMHTHHHRRRSDALLTSCKTVMADNPQLNVRLDDKVLAKSVYVLDARLEYSLHSQLTHTAKKVILLHDAAVKQERVEPYIEAGLRCVGLPVTAQGFIDLSAMMRFLGEEDSIHDIWVEAGACLFAALIKERMMHTALIYVAPKVLGQTAMPGLLNKEIFTAAKVIEWRPFGQDVLCHLEW